jgi:hypothetical protein
LIIFLGADASPGRTEQRVRRRLAEGVACLSGCKFIEKIRNKGMQYE